MTSSQLMSIIEALVLSSPEPLHARRITQVVPDATPSLVSQSIAELNQLYCTHGSAFRIREIAGGYQYYILPDFLGYVEELFTRRRKMRLTRAALETVAIVAYKQPVTKNEIEHIRGVASDAVVQNLMEKNLVTITGRSKSVGRPLQYGTTDEFLKFFGLNTIDALPKMSEIEEMVAAAQPQNQTELELKDELAETARDLKLNVADGTFDPSTREESDLIDNISTESGTERLGQAFHIQTISQEEPFQSEIDEITDEPVTTEDSEKLSDPE